MILGYVACANRFKFCPIFFHITLILLMVKIFSSMIILNHDKRHYTIKLPISNLVYLFTFRLYQQTKYGD
jgi:hypothetical protein